MRNLLLLLLFWTFQNGIISSQVTCSGGGSPAILNFNPTGLSSYDEYDDPDNYSTTLISSIVGDVVGIEYTNINLTTVGDSWCIDAVIDFSDAPAAFTNYYSLTPSSYSAVSPCDDLPTSGFLDLGASGDVFQTGPGGEVYIELWESFDDNTDAIDATYTSGSINIYVCPTSQVLPIKIKNLIADEYGKYNKIIWETASEVNNHYQVIEKSEDGKKDWIEVGKLQGTNSNNGSKYEIVDLNPFNLTFYRLKSVDFDGFTQLSDIVSVKRNTNENAMLEILNSNNTNDKLLVKYISAGSEFVNFTIMDINGKQLKKKKFSLTSDNNYFIETEDLTSGIYFIKSDDGYISDIRKFLR